LRGGRLTEVPGPFGLNLGLDRAGHRDRGRAAFGDLHEARAGVRRVGYPADVTSPLQLIDQESCRLLGDLGPLGQLGHPRARRVDLGEDPALSD
jgi:hypothetical protein